jgi:hypothetical protein
MARYSQPGRSLFGVMLPIPARVTLTEPTPDLGQAGSEGWLRGGHWTSPGSLSAFRICRPKLTRHTVAKRLDH